MSFKRRAKRKAERKAERKAQRAYDERENARHEAAHAVVSVRLGLPLASTDVQTRVVGNESMPSLNSDEVGLSSGYTTLVEGSAEAWRTALPDSEAKENLKRLATQAAAGIAAECLSRGAELSDPAHRDDLYQVVQIAGGLGIGNSTDDPAVRKWLSERFLEASEILTENDGKGWRLVTEVLFERGRLEGDEVRHLVELAKDL